MAKVLVVGSGCREHALAEKLSLSPDVGQVLVAPGNGGTCQTGTKITCLDLKVKDIDAIVNWCTKNRPFLVVVGPEDPLNDGLADKLMANRIRCFGPTQTAAQIECDKGYAKEFMKKYSIPTAEYRIFDDYQRAKDFIDNDRTFSGYVVKATGLAAGKGVVVARDRAEARLHARNVLENKSCGASDRIVIEDKMQGYEVSQLVFCDGDHFEQMPPAQDYKRAYDNDEGPNTGGMGSICPVEMDPKLRLDITNNIIIPTIRGLRSDNRPFVGVLYFGLMITADGPKVVEYNCRFGDPECQSVLPLLSSDLYHIMMSCVDGTLDRMQIHWKTDKFACGVVLASENYPSKPIIDRPIKLDRVPVTKDLMIIHGGTRKQANQYMSSGGRILTVVSVEKSLQSAMKKAKEAIALIELQGSHYRRDIGENEVKRLARFLTYKSSGVDIEAGDNLVKSIGKVAASTHRPEVLGSIGGFGAMFKLNLNSYRNPVLVSGTDGVGTKLEIANAYQKHDTIGIDLVAMCVNDILVQGAEPLFFLDYFACGRLDVDRAATVITSIAQGCHDSGCSLIGGETAEMPGMYHGEDYDLAGFAVGIVDEADLLPKPQHMQPGDVIIGITSSGLHSNGYSLVRKIIQKNNLKYSDDAPFDRNQSLGELILTPTKLYVKQLLPLIRDKLLKGLAHITGGGLIHNIPRVLPDHLAAHLDASTWPTLPLYRWIHEAGPVSPDEMLQTFNCGLGMVCIVSKDNVKQVITRLRETSTDCFVVGSLEQRSSQAVIVDNFLNKSNVISSTRKKRVAVLISGTGTNLQALIDYEKSRNASYEIKLVISNKDNVAGLERARKASIEHLVISHVAKKRVDFDMEMHQVLMQHQIDIVALAGFMRLLSSEFVKLWSGKLINIHPSLLPSFKGMDSHSQATAAGVTVHGCTVHFVDEGLDSGAIIMQKAIQVASDDTPETLAERVKSEAEHSIYPLALDNVAKGLITLHPDTKRVIRLK